MTEIKELRADQLDKILAFWEASNQTDAMCNTFYGICMAAANGYGVLTNSEFDDMYQLKYKYGRKILRRIGRRSKSNAKLTGRDTETQNNETLL